MLSNPNRASTITYMIMVLVMCWFIVVVVYHWVMRDYPTSYFVLLMVFGMCAVGAVAGFAVSALTNIALRTGPPKLRVPFSAIIWLAGCGLVADWLYKDGADAGRTLIATAIAAASGLIVGPMNAELIVGRWYYSKAVKSRPDAPAD